MLQTVNCSETKVSDLAPLAGLAALQTLYCWQTPVADLAPLAGLAALQTLNFAARTQVADLAPLAGLAALQTLYCSGTPVADLAPSPASPRCKRSFAPNFPSPPPPPSTKVSDLAPLAGLGKLRKLNCSMCRLTVFPMMIMTATSLEELILYDFRLPDTPAEVLSQSAGENCLASLRAHFHDLESGSVATTDVKLIVLGNGRVGKTQFCRRLRGEDYDETIDSTHGIVVTSAALPARNGEDAVRLHIWDFGGQDIYHGTHALFARSSAVFALIWAPVMEDRRTHRRKGRHRRISRG